MKQTCGLCASMLGMAIVLPALQSCSSLLTIQASPEQGRISIDKSLFNEENRLAIIKNDNQEFDIALVNLSGEDFRAFELQCTHQSNPLVPTKTGFFCNAHGSAFSFDGKVKTPPAQNNLKEFKVELNANQITIYL